MGRRGEIIQTCGEMMLLSELLYMLLALYFLLFKVRSLCRTICYEDLLTKRITTCLALHSY